MALPILYQDRDLIVVNKPSGLLVHRSAIDRHATEFALQTVRDQIEQTVYPVHRLDRPTSGALIFALSSDVARILATAFAQGEVHLVGRDFRNLHESGDCRWMRGRLQAR